MNTCPTCNTLRSPLTHTRLGYCEGLHYFNCACGSTYCLTPSGLLHAVTEEQGRIAEFVLTRALNTSEAKERRRLAAELGLKLGFKTKEDV